MDSRSVIIENYNYEWSEMFTEIVTILHEHLGDLILSIEHVGSTSVPGLASKPIIDIDIVIESMILLPVIVRKLSELGYLHEGNLGIENREAFARNDNKVPYNNDKEQMPEHHLYVCNKESDELIRHLTFRNILRAQPHLVEAYAVLKRELAEKYKNDRQAYTEGKSTFVNAVMNEYKDNLEVTQGDEDIR